jgi:hypothetical protein
LNDPKARLLPSARNCLKALHAVGTGHAGQAGGFLTDAVKGAGASSGNSWRSRRPASPNSSGSPEAATQAWSAMLQNPRTTVPAATMLLRLAKSHDDLSIERLVYRHLLGPLGDQKQVRYQNAYLDLPFNEKATAAAAELVALNKQYPNDVDIYMALALAELRQPARGQGAQPVRVRQSRLGQAARPLARRLCRRARCQPAARGLAPARAPAGPGAVEGARTPADPAAAQTAVKAVRCRLFHRLFTARALTSGRRSANSHARQSGSAMSLALNQQVLVLNRLWQAVNVCSVRRALTLLFEGHAQVVFGDDGGDFSRPTIFRQWRDLSQAHSEDDAIPSAPSPSASASRA